MQPITSTKRWLPVGASIRNSATERSAAALVAVVDQFDVEHNPRFLPRGGDTFCNIFATDVADAMGVPLPHWIDTIGRPSRPGATGARELNVNALIEWLDQYGRTYGWTEAAEEDAVKRADDGHFCVAVWRSPGVHGHIAVHLPGGQYAQAGAVCRARATKAECFPRAAMRVRHYTHD